MSVNKETWDKLAAEYIEIFRNVFGETLKIGGHSSLPGPMGQFIPTPQRPASKPVLSVQDRK